MDISVFLYAVFVYFGMSRMFSVSQICLLGLYTVQHSCFFCNECCVDSELTTETLLTVSLHQSMQSWSLDWKGKFFISPIWKDRDLNRTNWLLWRVFIISKPSAGFVFRTYWLPSRVDSRRLLLKTSSWVVAWTSTIFPLNVDIFWFISEKKTFKINFYETCIQISLLSYDENLKNRLGTS